MFEAFNSSIESMEQSSLEISLYNSISVLFQLIHPVQKMIYSILQNARSPIFGIYFHFMNLKE